MLCCSGAQTDQSGVCLHPGLNSSAGWTPLLRVSPPSIGGPLRLSLSCQLCVLFYIWWEAKLGKNKFPCLRLWGDHALTCIYLCSWACSSFQGSGCLSASIPQSFSGVFVSTELGSDKLSWGFPCFLGLSSLSWSVEVGEALGFWDMAAWFLFPQNGLTAEFLSGSAHFLIGSMG